MAADQTLTVRVVGDERDLLRSLKSSATATQKFSASFGTFVKGAVAFEAVRAGADALGSAIRAGVDEFNEASKVAAQTNAVIAATGGIAGVTAKRVDQLATRIQNLSGIDDEAIKAGENLILTFKNVRNAAGAGNAVFDRATKAAVNLSVAGFGAITSTAKFVAKALQDPIKGLSALGRAGVTFTQAQKDQIKALVESNRFLGAQKIVLREIESQVGGSAKALGDTLPGQLSKLREAFRNVLGDLVGAVATPLASAAQSFASFIPTLQEGARRLTDAVAPALETIVSRWTANARELQGVAGALLEPFRQRVLPIARELGQTLVNAWTNVVQVFSDNREELSQVLDNLGSALQNVWAIARPTIVFLFEKALPAALNIAIPVLEKVSGVVRVLSEVFVKTVSTIVKAVDVFLGGISTLTDAASHIPFIGDHFKGVSDKVNAARGSLQSFSSDLDALNGRQVNVDIVMNVAGAPASRAREGTVPQRGEADDVEKQVKTALEKQTVASRQIQSAATTATQQTEKARKAVDKQEKERERLQAAMRAKRERRIGRQFETLGLTSDGQERVASAAALLKRAGSLSDQIKGTALDTTKTRTQLQRIGKVLSGQFGAVGRNVRQAILGMLNDISSALDGGDSSETGPLTKFRVPNVGEILKQFPSLSPEERRKLGQFLSRRGANGSVAQGSSVGGAFGFAPAAMSGGGSSIVINNVTVENPRDFDSFIDEIEKRSRRRARTRTGRHK